MSSAYDQLAETLLSSTCPDVWKLYESFPHLRSNRVLESTPDAALVVDALIFATDIIRATIIEQARLTRETLKKA